MSLRAAMRRSFALVAFAVANCTSRRTHSQRTVVVGIGGSRVVPHERALRRRLEGAGRQTQALRAQRAGLAARQAAAGKRIGAARRLLWRRAAERTERCKQNSIDTASSIWSSRLQQGGDAANQCELPARTR